MNRRAMTLLAGLIPMILLAVLGSIVKVPYVALGPGPTFNTLGEVDGKQVVDVKGVPLDPTSGHLNMTTVSVRTDLNLFTAIGLWASGRQGVVPREEVYPPDKTKEEVDEENDASFQESENSAELAALHHLDYPFEVKIADVLSDGPAKDLLRKDDVLRGVGGRPVTTNADVKTAMAGTSGGQDVVVQYSRDGVDGRALVTLAPDPNSGDRGIIGITTTETPVVPFTVDFNLAEIGGPSAGLMFALALIDKLTPGELNGGKFIAGTGTIDPNGEVGPIGGITYKLIAARESGATTFLVPAQNCSEAKTRGPDGLQLVRVDNLSGAVAALGAIATGGEAPIC